MASKLQRLLSSLLESPMPKLGFHNDHQSPVMFASKRNLSSSTPQQPSEKSKVDSPLSSFPVSSLFRLHRSRSLSQVSTNHWIIQPILEFKDRIELGSDFSAGRGGMRCPNLGCASISNYVASEYNMIFYEFGKVVAKFCAKYLHTQVLKNEASAGDLGVSIQKSFFRMDEMMRGQRGWRELAVLGDKINMFTGMIEGFIWSPKAGDSHDQQDDWAFEKVYLENILTSICDISL
ncbi:uncharacterized protein A4U43_C03F11980 [Asparagus officinalis]|uniref:Uncharacterized protein n=1 Tax=Asparagus officinalis TaxID=4686 RepID=A0A5P1FEA6_ASPOF|nr:uncharacterized protein A4U43_C03F11980 [Asparagus officinalis]